MVVFAQDSCCLLGAMVLGGFHLGAHGRELLLRALNMVVFAQDSYDLLGAMVLGGFHLRVHLRRFVIWFTGICQCYLVMMNMFYKEIGKKLAFCKIALNSTKPNMHIGY